MKKNFFIENSEILKKLITDLDYNKIDNLYIKIKKFKKSTNKIFIFVTAQVFQLQVIFQMIYQILLILKFFF